MIFINTIRKLYGIILNNRAFLFLFSNFLLFISKSIEAFIKKDHNLIVFGSSNGIYYSDNSKVLFEWINQNQTQIKCVWLTHRRCILHEMRNKGYESELSWSAKGIYTLFIAPIGCYTNSLRDLSPDPWLFPKKIGLIALRHGKSVKKVREALQQFKLTYVEKKSRLNEKSKIKVVLSTSISVSKWTQQTIGVEMDKIVVTGFPRNDCFFNKSSSDQEIFNKLISSSKCKVLLYAPSWRNGRIPTKFFPFDDFSIGKLSTILKRNEIKLLLRPHPTDLLRFPQINDFLKKLTNSCDDIILADSITVPDIYSILPFIDCLITDYSATYHDYLLANRPIWFIPYDYVDFKTQNGFVYDYLEKLPGPRINSFGQFISEIENLTNGKDRYFTKRKALAELIHQYNDGLSSERVFSLIKNLT